MVHEVSIDDLCEHHNTLLRCHDRLQQRLNRIYQHIGELSAIGLCSGAARSEEIAWLRDAIAGMDRTLHHLAQHPSIKPLDA